MAKLNQDRFLGILRDYNMSKKLKTIQARVESRHVVGQGYPYGQPPIKLKYVENELDDELEYPADMTDRSGPLQYTERPEYQDNHPAIMNTIQYGSRQ